MTTGQGVEGAKLLGASEALREALDSQIWEDDRLVYEQSLALARSQLGEEAFEQARQEGRAMSMQEAAAYALEHQSDT